MVMMQRSIEVMTRSQSLRWVPVLLVIALFTDRPGIAVAASGKTPVAAVNATGDIGVKGYDPVAYFTLGQPTPGLDQYTYRWKGVTYRFASADNLNRFKTDPEKYLPQYGGYCAYAMAINRIADIDPSRWAIVDGKLYLNNNFLSYHLWSLNKSGNIAAADRNWPQYPKKVVGE
jgi:YHS domain-containing protein